MFKSEIIDLVFLLSLTAMWLALFYHAFVTVKGYEYFKFIQAQGEEMLVTLQDLPGVSVLVPAKNEEQVLEATLNALLELDYPKDRIELVILNDGSTDNTKKILDEYAAKYSRIKPVHIPVTEQCHGKAAVLNEGLKHSKYDLLVVFDADNVPEILSVQYLVRALLKDEKFAAVCGKIRTLNRNKNLLTRFANIEFIVHQWLLQGGRWRAHRIALLPGTNYVIRRDALLKAGSWDPKALTEDTELSLRLFTLGYTIAFFPLANSWEQEPEDWVVWRRQRLRWIQGNKYIVKRFLVDKSFRKANFANFFYMFVMYYALVLFIALSDIIFILGLLGLAKVSFLWPLVAMWAFAIAIFTLEIMIALTCEVGEATWSNFGLAVLMYFTYCQQWLYVALKSFVVARNGKKKVFWDKTQRFKV